eukprot:m.141599 g.141599  ORF g.141599 m.141599 type:complete len:636 (+) comp20379_c0_seq3:286-2193(+)
MALVKQDIETVEKNTAQSMQLLVELDSIKGRMEATSAALQEADNWTTLSADIEAAFEAEDIKKVSSTLLGMQRSLMVLSDVPDYAQRQAKLDTLQNRLEALIAPRLLAAFNTHNAEAAKECVVIFQDMKRQSSIQSYYIRCNKNKLNEVWSSMAQSEQPLPQWLPLYHDQLLAVWKRELAFCSHIFPAAEELLRSLLLSVLTSRQPSMHECLQTYAAEQGAAHTLERAVEVYLLTRSFVLNINMDTTALLQAAIEPFAHYQLDYAALQTETLLHWLRQLDLDFEACGPDHIVAKVKEAVPRLPTGLQRALQACDDFTCMRNSTGLAEAVQNLYLDVCLTVRDASRRITAVAPGRTVEDEEYWEQFQAVFQLLQQCGIMLEQASSFGDEVRQRLLARRDLLQRSNSSVSIVDGELVTDFIRSHAAAREACAACLERAVRGEALISLACLEDLGSALHQTAYDAVLSPVATRLRATPQLPIWTQESSADDVNFSLSPSMHITKIGEHLLTLPQQLDPFLAQGDEHFARAMASCTLPFDATPEDRESVADCWLSGVAQGIMKLYVNSIVAIPRLSSAGEKQLCKDIDYLCNVLSAVDVTPSPDLLLANRLLSIPRTELADINEGDNEQLARAVQRMRS